MSAKSKKKKKAAPKKTGQKIEPKVEPKIEQKIEQAAAPANGTSGLIKTAIIAATFVSMAALSIFSQGLDGGWPSPGVVAVRFALLSVLSVIYFLMLNMAKLSRKKDAQEPQVGKK